MKWRIVANSAALVVSISIGVAVGSGGAAATPTSASTGGGGYALDALTSIRIENEHPAGYQRALFKHWLDVDKDGCDAREQVLIRDSIKLPQVDGFDCSVIAGDWLSAYDGVRWSDPTNIDIDHVVALKETWDSGAWAWSEAIRTAYANDTTDTRTLLAVTDRVNQQKSDKDPSNWMPPLQSYWCKYIADWISIKARWNLSMDKSEYGRIKNILTASCPGLMIAKWKEAPLIATMPAVTTSIASASESTVTTVTKSRDISPGAYCTPENGLGTFNGTSYICSKKKADGRPYSDGRAHWRRG